MLHLLRMQLTASQKGWLKWIVKLLLTTTALYFVFTKTDYRATWHNLKTANPSWFLLSVMLFLVAKVISVFRFGLLIGKAGIRLEWWYNLRLYFVGAFYNFFLPGSVGGDAYRVFVLEEKFDVPLKDVFSAALLDRLSGLIVLIWLAAIGVFWSGVDFGYPYIQWLNVTVMCLLLPVYFLAVRFVFPVFHPTSLRIILFSLAIQSITLLHAFVMLKALGVTANYAGWLTLYLFSSVAAIAPVTIAGLGLREMVFLYGMNHFGVDQNTAIAFTLLLFANGFITSLIGVLFIPRIDE